MDVVHKFSVGQTVDLIPSTFRSAAKGDYEIVSLRPAENGSPQYRIAEQADRLDAHQFLLARDPCVITMRLSLRGRGQESGLLTAMPAQRPGGQSREPEPALPGDRALNAALRAARATLASG